MSGQLEIAGRKFSSRLLLGTGKFSSNEVMRDALAASGTEIVTVALRRADISGRRDPYANILDFIDPSKYLLLPNTSGAIDATRSCAPCPPRGRSRSSPWVKLEIHPDPQYLLPDPIETLRAAEILVKEGFTVLPYINADPVLAKRLAGYWHRDGHAIWARPSGAIGVSKRVLRSRSLSSRLPCLSSLMLASERLATPRRPSKWEQMPCW